jgi:hypothetical protein
MQHRDVPIASGALILPEAQKRLGFFCLTPQKDKLGVVLARHDRPLG